MPNAFEDFWLRIGDRIKISTPIASRSIEVRRVLAARAFERWRTGRLEIEMPDLPLLHFAKYKE